MPYVIARGGFSGRRSYVAGFKLDGNDAPRARPRLRWSPSRNDAMQFARESDAKEVILGFRLFRLSPCAVRID
jgi:hypothetical protein